MSRGTATVVPPKLPSADVATAAAVPHRFPPGISFAIQRSLGVNGAAPLASKADN